MGKTPFILKEKRDWRVGRGQKEAFQKMFAGSFFAQLFIFLGICAFCCCFSHHNVSLTSSVDPRLWLETREQIRIVLGNTLYSILIKSVKSTSPAALQFKITVVITSDVYTNQKTGHINCTGWSIPLLWTLSLHFFLKIVFSHLSQ